MSGIEVMHGLNSLNFLTIGIYNTSNAKSLICKLQGIVNMMLYPGGISQPSSSTMNISDIFFWEREFIFPDCSTSLFKKNYVFSVHLPVVNTPLTYYQIPHLPSGFHITILILIKEFILPQNK